jgi:hypothetical protein
MKPNQRDRKEIQALIAELQKHVNRPTLPELLEAAKNCRCKASYAQNLCPGTNLVPKIEALLATRYCKFCDRICDDAFCPVCDDGPFYYANKIELEPIFVCCEETQSYEYCSICGQYQESIVDAEPIALDHSKAKTQWRREIPELEDLLTREVLTSGEKEKLKRLASNRYCRECKVVWASDAKRCSACACSEYVILQQEFECSLHCNVDWGKKKHCGKCGIKLY